MIKLLDFLIDSLEDSRRKLEYIIDYIRKDGYLDIYKRPHTSQPVTFAEIGELRGIIDRLLNHIEWEEKRLHPYHYSSELCESKDK